MLGYILFVPLIFLIACVYSSIGLGGGSACLSVLSFWNSNPETLRPIAWTLNIAVTGVGFVKFYREGKFDPGLAWPFLAGGIAGGAFGSRLPLNEKTFQLLLAVTLFYASSRMFLSHQPSPPEKSKVRSRLISLVIGMVIGIISGLVGIGGGIILGPALVAMGWADVKKAAAVTSLYIMMTSLGALSSYVIGGGRPDPVLLAVFGAAAVIGGVIGSRWGAGKASESLLQNIFGFVTAAAGIRLLISYLGLG